MAKKWNSLYIIPILFFYLVLNGCVQGEESSENEESLKTVLETQLSGPDEDLIGLIRDPSNRTIIGDAPEDAPEGAQQNEPNDLDLYLEAIYKEYFIESAYETFIGEIATSYQVAAHLSGYEISPEEINIDRSENGENSYHFSVNVEISGDDGDSTENVEGRANFNDEGKISNIDYSSGELLNTLQHPGS